MIGEGVAFQVLDGGIQPCCVSAKKLGALGTIIVGRFQPAGGLPHPLPVFDASAVGAMRYGKSYDFAHGSAPVVVVLWPGRGEGTIE